MTRLFISYARKDGRELAQLLAGGVLPYEAWLDTSQIEGGEDWSRDIEKGIDNCDVFLTVLTPAYSDSYVSRLELARAVEKKKRRIPLLAHLQADRTLWFSGIQYIDFTDDTARTVSIEKLRDAIEHPPPPDEDPATREWDPVLARTARNARRFVRAQEGTAKAPGTFRTELYVRREEAERGLAAFLADRSALIVVGDSGVGKTNLVCRWTLDLINQGHAVLPYDCSALFDVDVDTVIARNLAVRPDDLTRTLETIDAEASRVERNLVLIFESVGDFRSKDSGPADLIRSIYALANRVGSHTRVLVSCNAVIWNRIQRSRPMRFDPELYFHSADDEPFLRLDVFTPQEVDRAYPCYRDRFRLQSTLEELGPVVRERLRDPVLLRITAEAFSGAKQPLLPAHIAAARVYSRFYDARVVDETQRWLVSELVKRMLGQKTGTLAMNDLAAEDRLRPELLREDPGSAYLRLLDCGVLQELRTEGGGSTLIRFSHTLVAAYAMARHLSEQKDMGDVTAKAAAQVAQVDDFPLAWEIAKTLLLITADRAPILTFAASANVEERELAAEALMALHAEDADAARALLQSLLDRTSEEGRRTALKAAYQIGPEARDFFLRAAIEGEPKMRESVKNTLYLIWRNEPVAGRRSVTDTLYVIWRHAPNFTYEFLRTLLGELKLENLFKLPKILEFILDLTITIYINHCDDPNVIAKTAELLDDLSLKRLHLDKFRTDFLGDAVERVVFRAIAKVFGGQILDWMLFADDKPVAAFFALPAAERARLGRVGDAFDPAFDPESVYDDLREMLRSDVPIFSGSATMAVAIHAAHDFAKTRPLIDRLWQEVGAGGRLWLLVGFSVLIRSTPGEWVGLLEELTSRYIDEHRDAFLCDAKIAGNLDIVLLPLGLAYSKQAAPMKLFETLLATGLASDPALVARCVAALGVVGFYDPEAMFETIRPVMARLDDASIRQAVIANLATVRTLHFDAVDRFLGSVPELDALRHEIDVAADVDLVRRYIRVLGYYNNAVHFSLEYPRMRKPLSTGALKLLATAPDAAQFIADYTRTALGMARAAGYQAMEWTKPE